MDLVVMVLLLPLAAFGQQLTGTRRCTFDRDCGANEYCKARQLCQCIPGYRAEKDPTTAVERCDDYDYIIVEG